MTSTLTANDLEQFIGTENWHRHGLVRAVTYTDGVKFLAEQAGAYWLIDEIALAQKFIPAVKVEEFQVWKLTVREGRKATVTCDDGNGNVVYHKNVVSRTSRSTQSSCTAPGT